MELNETTGECQNVKHREQRTLGRRVIKVRSRPSDWVVRPERVWNRANSHCPLFAFLHRDGQLIKKKEKRRLGESKTHRHLKSRWFGGHSLEQHSKSSPTQKQHRKRRKNKPLMNFIMKPHHKILLFDRTFLFASFLRRQTIFLFERHPRVSRRTRDELISKKPSEMIF